MADKKLFGFLILCLLIYISECGRFGGRSSGRSSSSSRGGSSWGKGWGGSSSSSGSSWGSSSSGSSYKPSSSWSTGSSSGSSSWGSSYKPSSSYGSHSYPSSSSGLSGSSSSSGSYNYPSFDFSWNKPSSSSGSHSYPSSSTGLSGSGSNSWLSKPSSGSGSHSYPSSSTGLSGSGTGSHSYPSSNGWSGSGSKYPSSGTHSYPSSPGHSGSGSSYNRPSNSYNTNSGYHGSYQTHYVPTYYSAPQHVYVTQYRDSSSRYGDLLTGLTLYNMGRTHSHYHDHYYYDDYYRQRYHPVGNSNSYQQESTYKASSEATCTLRIKENGKLEVLKIPCEIVSTFTEGSKKIENEKQVNQTICTTNTTVTKTSPTTNLPVIIESAESTSSPSVNVTVASIANVTISPSTTEAPIVSKTNKTDGNVFTQTIKTQTATETTVNVTVCTTQSYIDPLSVKGAPIGDASNMECAIDIRTADSHFRNTVECKTLMEYSKMSAPAKAQKPLLPPREKLKSWIEKPPWWMSLFIAV